VGLFGRGESEMKLTKIDVIVIALLLATPIFALADVIFIGEVGYWEYLFICVVEVGLFAMGYWMGKKASK